MKRDGGESVNKMYSQNTGSRKSIIKKHKNGKYQLQLKDEQNNQIYKINAPNEILFNENLAFTLEDH